MSLDRELKAQSPLNWLLYYAAQSADDIFQALLVQEYGKDAGHARYMTWDYPREDINVACRQFVALSDAWFKYFRGYKQDWLE